MAGKVNGIFVNPRIKRGLDFIDAHLGESTWFAGNELTIADLQMSFPLMAARGRAGLGSRTNIAAWLDKVESRPAFKRAIEKGGPIAF